jgi:hypothetical protein
MRSLALLVRFMLELAALAALVVGGHGLVNGVPGWAIGIAAAAVAATLWGLFVAPRARVALPTPGRLTIEVVIFLAASAGLVLANQPLLGGLLIGIYLLDRLALWASGSPLYERA